LIGEARIDSMGEGAEMAEARVAFRLSRRGGLEGDTPLVLLLLALSA
jgi:hypothetical protein